MASEWAVENKEERLREEDYCGDSSRGQAQKNILYSFYNRALIWTQNMIETADLLYWIEFS